MNKLLKTYNFSNFKITKSNGSYLYPSKNEKLLDFSSGVAVNSLGYNHPIIKKSLQNQIKTGISHLSGSQIHEFKIKLSELLSLKKVIRAMSFSPIQVRKALKQLLKSPEIMEINLKKMKS